MTQMMTPRMTAAFDMAREVHIHQTLKGTELPYLLHLLDVCSIALRHGADEDQAIAALLHDTVEDGGGMAKAEEILETFGARVQKIVLDLSDSVVDDPNEKLDWWHRKLDYLEHLKVATHDTALVSGADKLSNARSIVADLRERSLPEERDEFWGRFNTGRVGSLWYYQRLAVLLPDRLPSDEGAQRLGRALVATVEEMVKEVGAEQAALDWDDAVQRAAQKSQDALARRLAQPSGS